MADTKIEWSDKVWNCIRGCSIVSDGCRFCYAMRQAHRFNFEGGPYQGLTVLTSTGPKWNGDVTLLPDKLGDPMRWKKPARIFVNSMSDVFHEGVDDSFIDRIFGVIQLCPQHIFQILTKRPERMMQYMNEPGRGGKVMEAAAREAFDQDTLVSRHGKLPETAEYHWEASNQLGQSVITVKTGTWPPPNAWLGTSVENQKTFVERMEYLVATKASVRWLSVEPLLGPIDASVVIHPSGWVATAYALANTHWVVVGGESGPGARPMHPEWACTLRDQCNTRGIPYFFKQWGDWSPQAANGFTQWPVIEPNKPVLLPAHPGRQGQDSHQVMVRLGKHKAGRVLDGREWNEYPRI